VAELPAGLSEAITEWYESPVPILSTGPLAVADAIKNACLQSIIVDRELPPIPMLFKGYSQGDAVVTHGVRTVNHCRHPDTDQEIIEKHHWQASRWRLTSAGWRVCDIRMDGTWLSRSTCLHRGRQHGSWLRARQVLISRHIDRLTVLEWTNTSDQPATVGCGCAGAFSRKATTPSGEHGHFEISVAPGERYYLAHKMFTHEAHGVRFAVWRPGLTRPEAVVLAFVGHARPLQIRGWCRHSRLLAPDTEVPVPTEPLPPGGIDEIANPPA
jgi:hypothetical protein